MTFLLSDTMNSFLIGLLEFGKGLIIIAAIWIIIHFILNLLGIDEKTKLAIYIILWSSALIWGFFTCKPRIFGGRPDF